MFLFPASGSKDNQQPVKLWEPKTGTVLTTLHAHKSTVMDIKWNANGNWLLTASRDHLLKIFDIRNTKEELQTFRGHKKEVSTVAWHPVHEGIFASGGSDGSIMFWSVGADKEVGAIETAHESIVWALSWHPAGHILCSGMCLHYYLNNYFNFHVCLCHSSSISFICMASNSCRCMVHPRSEQ